MANRFNDLLLPFFVVAKEVFMKKVIAVNLSWSLRKEANTTNNEPTFATVRELLRQAEEFFRAAVTLGALGTRPALTMATDFMTNLTGRAVNVALTRRTLQVQVTVTTLQKEMKEKQVQISSSINHSFSAVRKQLPYITLVTPAATVARLADALARNHVAHVFQRTDLRTAARLAAIVRQAPVAALAALAAPPLGVADTLNALARPGVTRATVARTGQTAVARLRRVAVVAVVAAGMVKC